MVTWGLSCARLNGAYLRETGGHPDRQRTAWLKSLSGERGPRRQRSLLDWSMTISVLAGDDRDGDLVLLLRDQLRARAPLEE